MVIKTAHINDIEKITDLGEEFVAESPSLSLLSYSRKEYQRFCEDLISSKIKYMVIAKDKEKVVGVVGGGLHNRIGSSDKYLSEYIFYVSPSARKSGTGRQLMDKFCDWGRSQKVKVVEMGVTSDIDPKQADKFMSNLGFKYMGANFYKEL